MKMLQILWLIVAVSTTLEINAVPMEKNAALIRGLQEDLKEFWALIPMQKIEIIYEEYLAKDEDFGEVVDYILSNEFKKLITTIESTAEFKNVLNYLQDSGINAYKFINMINDFLYIDNIEPYGVPLKLRITGGLPGFVKDIAAVIPIDKIEKLYNEKLQSSQEFIALINRLRSPKFHSIFYNLMNNAFWKEFIGVAEAKGINIQAIRDFLESFIGIKFPSQ